MNRSLHQAKTVGRVKYLLLSAIGLTMAGCSPPDPAERPRVTNAYVAEPAGADAALYLTVSNPADRRDALLRVETEAAKRATLHVQVFGDGIVRMERVPEVEIPPKSEVHFAPGGAHVMLEDASPELLAGDTVEVTLVLLEAGRIVVKAPVVSYADLGEVLDTEGASEHHHGGGH